MKGGRFLSPLFMYVALHYDCGYIGIKIEGYNYGAEKESDG